MPTSIHESASSGPIDEFNRPLAEFSNDIFKMNLSAQSHILSDGAGMEWSSMLSEVRGAIQSSRSLTADQEAFLCRNHLRRANGYNQLDNQLSTGRRARPYRDSTQPWWCCARGQVRVNRLLQMLVYWGACVSSNALKWAWLLLQQSHVPESVWNTIACL